MTAPAASRATFDPQSPLRTALTQRVEAYLAQAGVDERGGPEWVVKALVLVTWGVASYVALVFFAESWWAASVLAASLGFAMAGIGFCVLHEGGHGACSRKGWVNWLAFASADFMGGSSYYWHHKHNVLHHTWANVVGIDDDIDASPLLRIAPSHPRFWFHRFQHLYVAPLVLFFVPKWTFLDDNRMFLLGRVGKVPVTRPRGWDLVQFLAFKPIYLAWAFVLPLSRHTVPEFALGYGIAAACLGASLVFMFQSAHAGEGTEFLEVPEGGGKLPRPFFEHHLAVTTDYAHGNRLATWYLGGLNYQIEHHLFPRLGQRHHPAIAAIVQDVCREQGVPYRRFPSVTAAVAAHFALLARMGRVSPRTEPTPA